MMLPEPSTTMPAELTPSPPMAAEVLVAGSKTRLLLPV